MRWWWWWCWCCLLLSPAHAHNSRVEPCKVRLAFGGGPCVGTRRRAAAVSRFSPVTLSASSSSAAADNNSDGTTQTNTPKTTTTTVKVYFDSSQGYHRDLRYHPEQPARIESCIQALQERQEEESSSSSLQVQLIDVAPASLRKTFNGVDWQPLDEKELAHARAMLVEVHSEEYVSQVEERCEASKRRRVAEGKDPWGYIGYVDGGDTFLTTESYGVLLRATAIWIRAVSHCLVNDNDNDNDVDVDDVDDVDDKKKKKKKKKKDKAEIAFCLTRPPGHHATQTTANGFCLFNFAAAATRHVLLGSTGNKVSVLDWDVHYGQGVTDILRNYKEARYVSIHQSPAFPYEGTQLEIVGDGQNIKTVPVEPGIQWDSGYRHAYVHQALPFVFASNPSLVLVCAGYDALASDPLANVNLNAADYGKMTRLLMKQRPSHCGLVFGLEGGYQLAESSGDSLAQAVLETIQGLIIPEEEEEEMVED